MVREERKHSEGRQQLRVLILNEISELRTIHCLRQFQLTNMTELAFQYEQQHSMVTSSLCFKGVEIDFSSLGRMNG